MKETCAQFGLMDVAGVDSMGNLDSMLEDDDEDLEVGTSHSF